MSSNLIPAIQGKRSGNHCGSFSEKLWPSMSLKNSNESRAPDRIVRMIKMRIKQDGKAIFLVLCKSIIYPILKLLHTAWLIPAYKG